MQDKYLQRGTTAAIICMLLDQIQKFYMMEIFNIAEKAPIEVTGFFNLVMVWNRGISFGMFQDMQYSNYFFMAFTTSIILLIFTLIKRSRSMLEATGFGMIIGGACGNLIDRVLHAGVADFFDFYYEDDHWPAFNIADSCVFLGAVLLILATLIIKEKKNEK